MTGIIICLGGRSSVTNRASSLKDFIKKGARYVINNLLTVTINVKINYSA